ncbi:uncharacterized protein LOC132203683 isoform X2 [Neocloeon triangulifer]|uniref:uncharacterized protein LOC132203683 isoform X2 n=1 Tax=Neocloeon triangulifer TaxID=2078957 RepID=UPI00286F831E|nr:uncharacterized protein LOC132203683 isoform X2 [Neocloeon triangulifer]
MVGDTQACLSRGLSASIEEMSTSRNTPRPEPGERRASKLINWPLVPLRITLFLFFGGLACLVVYLPLHMREVGLSDEHSRVIATVAPLLSILGPLIVGPAADRLGKHKVLLTGCLLLGAACYCLLLAVPLTSENGNFQGPTLSAAPNVQLRCNSKGARIVQELCSSQCPRWSDNTAWEMKIFNCKFDCGEKGEAYNRRLTSTTTTTTAAPTDDYDQPDLEGVPQNKPTEKDPFLNAYIGEPRPNLCFNHSLSSSNNLCNLMDHTSTLLVNISLPEVASMESTCEYPLSHIKISLGNESYSSLYCRGDCVVKCGVTSSLWDRVAGGHQICPATFPLTDPEVTFWSYLLARSVADIFPVAALPLADTLVVVLSSTHNSDVGRELSFGALGAIVVAPLVSLLVKFEITPWQDTPSALPILVFALLSLLAALALSWVKLPSVWYSRRMELGERPSVRVTHPGEALALLFVLLLLGLFWGALETYFPWFLQDVYRIYTWEMGLTVALGLVFTMPLLWNSETLIDYCGYTNIFIAAFVFYIIRFLGYQYLETFFVVETFEVFTLCLMWVTAVLYARNLTAKHLTATSQALIVLAHFCLGRFFGALASSTIGIPDGIHPRDFFKGCSVVAAIAGWLYFCIYYCCVRPGCGRKKILSGSGQLPAEAATTNGSYTPLRIYRGGDQEAKGHGRF